jgi:SAM-dependent methyltransferase
MNQLEEDSRTARMHHARRKSVNMIFAGVPRKTFDRALELGAGDCFQSQFLKEYTKHLTCTDFQFSNMIPADSEIRYMQCDAECIVEKFGHERFDLVFSSNMLQHTPDKTAVLKEIKKILAPDGVAILVMPNIWWKLFKLGLFYPLLVIKILSRIRRLFFVHRGGVAAQEPNRPNNPKFTLARGRLRAWLVPVPLGAYRSNTAEFLAFRKRAWLRIVENAGFEVINVRKGPFIVGDISSRMNDFLESVGLCTEFIYILKQPGAHTKMETCFSGNTRLAPGTGG